MCTWWRPFRNLCAALPFLLAVLLLPGAVAAEGQVEQKGKIESKVSEIWPTVVWNVRNAKLPVPKQFSTKEEVRERLASTGEDGYRRYLEDHLPKELEEDSKWRDYHEGVDGDGGRENLDFLRWQKLAFSRYTKTEQDELDWDGTPLQPPRKTSALYQWPALHGTGEYKALLTMVRSYCTKFLRQVGGLADARYNIFPWAEVYRPGDFQLPIAHTGAPAAGIYAARANGLQEFVILDERAYGAPFKRRHSVRLAPGEFMLFPSWAANLFTTNEGNSTNVYYRFWVMFEGGVNEFDWEDDPLGVYKKVANQRLQFSLAASTKPEGKDEL